MKKPLICVIIGAVGAALCAKIYCDERDSPATPSEPAGSEPDFDPEETFTEPEFTDEPIFEQKATFNDPEAELPEQDSDEEMYVHFEDLEI